MHVLAGKMAQQIKVLADKSEDLSSIPRVHMVKRENQLCKLSSDKSAGACANPQINTWFVCMLFFKSTCLRVGDIAQW